jgi:hypothetical protein
MVRFSQALITIFDENFKENYIQLQEYKRASNNIERKRKMDIYKLKQMLLFTIKVIKHLLVRVS